MGYGTNARKMALQTARPWTDAERSTARKLYWHALHIGEVAEKLGRTVMDVTTELGLGEPECVASVERLR